MKHVSTNVSSYAQNVADVCTLTFLWKGLGKL